MRFIIRKFVDAETAKEALEMEPKVPVHDVYLKEGEEPKRDAPRDLIGFRHPEEASFGFTDEPMARKK